MTDFKLIDDFFEGKQFTDEEWAIFERKLDEDDAFLGYYETQKLLRRLGRMRMEERLKNNSPDLFKKETKLTVSFLVNLDGISGHESNKAEKQLEIYEKVSQLHPKAKLLRNAAFYSPDRSSVAVRVPSTNMDKDSFVSLVNYLADQATQLEFYFSEEDAPLIYQSGDSPSLFAIIEKAVSEEFIKIIFRN